MSRLVSAEDKLRFSYGGGYLRKTAKGQSLTPAYQLKPEAARPRDKRKSALVEYALVFAAFCAILLTIVVLAHSFKARPVAHNAARPVAPYALSQGALRKG